MDINALLKALASGSGSPGDPWSQAAMINPNFWGQSKEDAARTFANPTGSPMMPHYRELPKKEDGTYDVMAIKTGSQDGNGSFGKMVGNAIIPQTMAAKGGASGG